MTTEKKRAPWDDLRAIAERIDYGGWIADSESGTWGEYKEDAARLRDIADAMEDDYEHMRDGE